ncbi:hypothetical protein GQ53DRAFT_307903 [Thozetella sp. PMI_491]|nr:hypothetical protein GQ53DRAFT_307903 [Thozetella sp. PMI_491]
MFALRMVCLPLLDFGFYLTGSSGRLLDGSNYEPQERRKNAIPAWSHAAMHSYSRTMRAPFLPLEPSLSLSLSQNSWAWAPTAVLCLGW